MTERFITLPGASLDLLAGCVLRDGKLVKVEPRAWRVLEQLVRHRHRGVTNASTMLREVGALFEKSLIAGQKMGEVTTRVSADLLAAYLVNTVEGARVMEKTRPGKERLQALAQFSLAALDP